MIRTISIFFLSIVNIIAIAQDYPYDVDYYPFINYDKNKILFFEDSSKFENLFTKLDKIIFEGKGNIDIVHIGGSHIQADIWSNQMRTRLQTIHPGLIGSRGFIFPYRLAKTNNPYNYKVSYTGEWDGCRCVKRRTDCEYGLTGVAAYTYDSVSTVEIELRQGIYLPYDFNKVTVYYNIESNSHNVELQNTRINEVFIDSIVGYIEFHLDEYTNRLNLLITKKDSGFAKFEIHGIKLDNDDPGITYHAMGANGADVPTYLRCSRFQKHLTTINPDLVILSVGVNDAHNSNYTPQYFRSNYDTLIGRILEVVPDVAILFTTNNDTYMRRRYVNTNSESAKNVMYDMAKGYKGGVWDMYSIMGGLHSIVVWGKHGLAKRDRVHFTKEGYILVGNLMFNALLESYVNHLDKNKTNIY